MDPFLVSVVSRMRGDGEGDLPLTRVIIDIDGRKGIDICRDEEHGSCMKADGAVSTAIFLQPWSINSLGKAAANSLSTPSQCISNPPGSPEQDGRHLRI